MIVKCKPTRENKTECPMIKTCLARLTDGTITGCGVPLWYGGLIRYDQIMVERTFQKADMRGSNNDSQAD